MFTTDNAGLNLPGWRRETKNLMRRPTPGRNHSLFPFCLYGGFIQKKTEAGKTLFFPAIYLKPCTHLDTL